jgi:hypothetical protein
MGGIKRANLIGQDNQIAGEAAAIKKENQEIAR